VGPGEGLPDLVTGRHRGLDVLLAGGGHVEELHALVGRTGHGRVLARSGRSPFAGDEVADRQLPARRQLAVAEDVGAQRLDVGVAHHAREEGVVRAPIRVARGQRVGSDLGAFVERADGGFEALVYEGGHGAAYISTGPRRGKGRSPKMAVPTRTRVAPSSMAAS